MDRNRRAAEKAAADHIAGRKPACGMARGLTLLAMYRHGQFHLGVKTDKGILDAPEEAQLPCMQAPGTIDDMLQDRRGPEPKCCRGCGSEI